MMNPFLIYALIGAVPALLLIFSYLYYTRDLADKKQINRRLQLMESGLMQQDVMSLIRKERGVDFASVRQLSWLQDYLTQTGLDLSGNRFALYTGVVACFAAVGFLALSSSVIVSVIVGLFSTAILMVLWVRMLRRRRIARFNGQLVEVLEVIVRSLRAGHPFTTSLALVSREMPDPIGSEFGILSDEIAYGLDIPTALQNLYKRVGDEELNFFITAVVIQNQTGGNLAELLERLAKLMRERQKLYRKVKALTSESRWSALVLTVLPVFIMVIIHFISPKYYTSVWNDEAFRLTLYVCGVMLVIGNYLMRKLTNLQY